MIDATYFAQDEIDFLRGEHVDLLLENGLSGFFADAAEVSGCLRDATEEEGVPLIGYFSCDFASCCVDLRALKGKKLNIWAPKKNSK